jgi:hypothetical protein
VFIDDGLYHDNEFPFVYALLANKSDETYATMLHHIKLRIRELKVNLLDQETTACDSELDTINEQQQAFPCAMMRLCFFHGYSIFEVVKVRSLQNDCISLNGRFNICSTI